MGLFSPFLPLGGLEPFPFLELFPPLRCGSVTKLQPTLLDPRLQHARLPCPSHTPSTHATADQTPAPSARTEPTTQPKLTQEGMRPESQAIFPRTTQLRSIDSLSTC